MKVVVTGAGGFLGRAVLPALVGRGHEVIGVARTAGRGLHRVDDYSQTPSGDALVHLAQSSDRGAVNAAGAEAQRAALADMNALLAKGYSRLVYASSAALYPDSLTRPARPEDATEARDCYAAIKLECERLALSGGRAVVARLSNLYGAGMSPANVLNDILRKLTGTGPVQLRDPAPVRDFLWVADAADGIVALVEARETGVFNLGSGVGVSVAELARQVLDLAGQPHREVVATSPGNRFSSIVLDISKSLDRLGWRPDTTLRQGLTELLNLQPIGHQ